MTPGRWHAAVAFALLGAELDLPATDAPDVAGLLAQLERAGWPARRVEQAARAATAAGAWPHPVPARLRSGLGAAQLRAAVEQARRAYGLDGLEVRGPTGRTTLTADERRLVADRPPHYGG